MADRICTIHNGVWELMATWGGSAVPGVGDRAVIPDDSHIPAAPNSDTTIQDLSVTAATFDAADHLTVSRHITLSGICSVHIFSQSGAGTVALGSNGSLFAAEIHGSVTGDDAGLLHGKLFGSLTATTGATLGLTFDSGAAVHFTNTTDLVWLTTDGTDNIGPTIITSTGDLVIIPGSADPFALGGATITVGGSLAVLPKVGLPSAGVALGGATITGPGTAGANFYDIGVIPDGMTIAGFEPLYTKDGDPTVYSARGATLPIILPDPSDVTAGKTYGVDNGETGTASAGGGGGNRGLGLAGLVG